MAQADGTLVESFVAEELGNSAYLIVSRETGEAASLLERAGFTQVRHVTDGYDEWQRHWHADDGHSHEHPHEHA